MAKKILAVVMAVVIAVSAMAISVFADQIPLYHSDAGSYSTDITMTFTIPVYGLYGYLTAGDYMVLDLPENYGWPFSAGTKTAWSIIVNGVEYALPTIEAATGDAVVFDKQEIKVVLGFLTHGWDGTSTTIPQTINFNQYNSFQLVGKITNAARPADWSGNTWDILGADKFGKDGVFGTKMKAQWYKEDGTPVPNSVSYAKDWTPAVNHDNKNRDNRSDFVTNELFPGTVNFTPETGAVLLNWDHTLANRAALYAADSVQFVVELNEPIVGIADYTLYVKNGTASENGVVGYDPSIWWTYSAARAQVDSIHVDTAYGEGPVTELRFNIDKKFIYEGNYGTYGEEFVIFENITLMNYNLMKDYLHIDRSNPNVGESGSWGLISWVKDDDIVRYNGQKVNYARTGLAGVGTANMVLSDTPLQTGTATANKAHGGQGHLVTDVTFHEGADYSYKLTATFTGTAPTQLGFSESESYWSAVVGSNLDHDATSFTITASATELAEKLGYKEGDKITCQANSWWANDEDYESFTLTVEEYGMVPSTTTGGVNNGATVTAKAVYLETVNGDATTPDTPTQSTDNVDDEDGDNITVEDDKKEENPKTGVALAVVPMLIAAAAAVVSKKH